MRLVLAICVILLSGSLLVGLFFSLEVLGRFVIAESGVPSDVLLAIGAHET